MDKPALLRLLSSAPVTLTGHGPDRYPHCGYQRTPAWRSGARYDRLAAAQPGEKTKKGDGHHIAGAGNPYDGSSEASPA
jgi:hypothetical protein